MVSQLPHVRGSEKSVQRALQQPKPDGQAMPQPPQLLGSLTSRFVHWMAGAGKPVEHTSGRPGGQTQSATEHTELAIISWQTFPHVPQFIGSLKGSVQKPLQSTCPGGQTHRPPTQEPPNGQTTPQAPQLIGSAEGSMHPSPQSRNKGWQTHVR